MRLLISSLLAVLFFTFYPALIQVNDAEERERHSFRAEARDGYSIDRKRRERKREHGKEGNEATGQVAAWIFVLANLKVGVSILARVVNRFSELGSGLGSSLTQLSRFLNKHLRKVHYLLNPTALVVAFLHFMLSACRSSPLPEWGLLLVSIMVLLGLMLRFRVPFRWMRKFVYRIHTGSVTFLMLITVLVTGHLMID